MIQLPTTLYDLDGDDRYLPTGLTRGPWDPGFQHAGPPAALLSRAVEAAGAIADGQVVRLSFDILRPVPIAPLQVTSRVLRPGRKVEQLESTLAAEDGTPLMRATAWRMRREAVALPPGVAAVDPPPPLPDGGEPPDFGTWKDDVAYTKALEWRFAEGRFTEPGPATVWTRLLVDLVAGEPPTPLQRLLVMADAASGVSSMLDWSTYSFANIDLGIHLERPPEGEWMAMAATTRLGREGAGLCTSVLFDERGRVGVSTHSLLVAPR
jgi:hypothetical protein